MKCVSRVWIIQIYVHVGNGTNCVLLQETYNIEKLLIINQLFI